MSDAYQFAIGRSRALVLAGCFLSAAALLFLAGAITGTLYSSRRLPSIHAAVSAPAVKTPQLPAVQASGVTAEPSTAPATAVTSAPGAPISGPAANASTAQATGASSATPPVAIAAAPSTVATTPSTGDSSAVAPSSVASAAAAAKPAFAPVNATASAETKPPAAGMLTPPPAPVETSYALPLAVRVGSFSVKSNADTLMQSLRDMGYQPAMNRSTDARGRIWYVVKLGPYTRWNAASRVAARISIAENVNPVIGPMR